MERGRRSRPRPHLPPRGQPADRPDAARPSARSTATRSAACSTTGTTRRPAEADDLAGDGNRRYPFLSSVDNGWLAAALSCCRTPIRANAGWRASSERMNFKLPTTTPRPGGKAGLMQGRLLGRRAQARRRDPVGNFLGSGPDVTYTAFHYDTTVSETRIASYIAIARGQVPAKLYFDTWRTFPATEDWSWHEQQPTGRNRTYLGIGGVRRGLRAPGIKVVPGWGGSMFEALMPDMFVPEERWSPRAWGRTTATPWPSTVSTDWKRPSTGSGASPPPATRAAATASTAWTRSGSIRTATSPTCRGPTRQGVRRTAATNPNPTYGDGVVTPHALFLAMHHEPRQAYDNLVKLTRSSTRTARAASMTPSR